MNCSFFLKRNISGSINLAFNKLHPVLKSSNEHVKSTGLFDIPVLQKASGFEQFQKNALTECSILVQKAVSKNRNQKIVEIFDQLSNCLCKVADLSEFVRIGHPFLKYQEAAKNASIAISNHVEKLNTNRELYEALVDVVKNGDIVKTSSLDDHVAHLFLKDFEQSGIHLDDEKRALLVHLNEYILNLGSHFVYNTQKPRIVSKSKIPQHIKSFFQFDQDKVIVNGLLGSSNLEIVRETAFKIYLQHDEEQDQLLTNFLQARLALAKLCGFNSFAERAIQGSILDTPNTVSTFLNLLSHQVKPLANQDYQKMLDLKKNDDSNSEEVMPWDSPYYAAYLKENKYTKALSDSAPYFSLGSCMQGLNLIFNHLFGIKMKVCETKPGETWCSDIIKLDIIDSQNNSLGYIYCDFFERQNKPAHDCHFTIQGGCQLADGTYQKPVVVLLLSLPSPCKSTPSLLSPIMVENLFHEMGHAIHSMLARTPYQHITGTRCSTDLAEVPSILMEYFTFDPRVVSSFAKHFETNQMIPDHLLKAWIESKKVFNASEVQCQLFYAVLDQVYHSNDPLMSKSNTTETLAEIQKKYFGLKYIPGTAWQLRFSHLVGYGARYYSYLVSRAVAKLIWNKLFKENPFSSISGQIYKDEVLCHGGGKPPKDIIEDVLSQKITPSSLSNSLLSDIPRCA